MSVGKRILSLLLAFGMVISMVPSSVFAEAEEAGETETTQEPLLETEPQEEPSEPETEDSAEAETEPEETVPPETEAEETAPPETEAEVSEPAEEDPFVWLGTMTFEELPDSDELLWGYLYQQGGRETPDVMRPENMVLSGTNKDCYNALVSKFRSVAANGGSTEFTVSVSVYNVDIEKIMYALLFNLPYEAYWFDKTTGVSCGGNSSSTTFRFYVARAYQDGSALKVSRTKANAAAASAANAKDIVTQYAQLSDYQKLQSYRQKICDLVSYNHTAAGSSSFPYGDPWQLIYVFDGDTSTDVVCEGYSKAFKYLCDLTEWSREVSVDVVDGYAGGPHMWNIVHINGNNYLADVTNCDSGTIGYPDKLFLKGASGSVSTYYRVNGVSMTYQYDPETTSSLADSLLVLSSANYVPPADDELNSGTCGDSLTWQLDNSGTLTLLGSGDMTNYASGKAPWYRNASDIHRIVLPEGLTSIGDYAFHGLAAAEEIEIPAAVTKIGKYAFYKCTSLQEITFLGNAPTFGTSAFSEVTALAIHSCAGQGWASAHKSYGGSLTWGLFHPAEFQEVIPAVDPACTQEGLTDGIRCSGCNDTLEPQEPVPALGHSYLNNVCIRCGHAEGTCGEGLSWVLEDGILTVTGSGAISFPGSSAPWAQAAEQITSVILPEGITQLNKASFAGCTSLREIVLPASVTAIGAGAFAGCTALTQVTFAGNAPAIASDSFAGVTAEASYSCRFTGWGAASLSMYGGSLTWLPEHVMETDLSNDATNHFYRCASPECSYRTDITPHTFASEWTVDASGHWHACTECGAITSFASHTPDREEPTMDDAVVCTVCAFEIAPRLAYVEITLPRDTLAAGSTIKLTAQVISTTGLRNTVNWYVDEADAAYASIGRTSGQLKAANVSEAHTVTVIAAAADDETVRSSVSVTIYPLIRELAIYPEGSDTPAASVRVDVNSADSISLRAMRLPESALGEIAWTTSDSAGIYGTLTADGDYCTVSNLHLPAGKTASFTLTASARDGSGTSASITVLLAADPSEIAVNVPETGLQLRGGQSVTLTAVPQGALITNRNIVWSIPARDAAYASISSKGKLTTKTVYAPTNITVIAASAANPEVKTLIPVQLLPAVTAVVLESPIAAQDGIIPLSLAQRELQLTAWYFPGDVIRSGSWKTSDKKTATVENGRVTFLKPGLVTVTFTAADGSKKTASVKIRCGNPVEEIRIFGASELMSGNKATLTASVSLGASCKTVIWESDSPAAKVSAKGVVTAGTVYADTPVTITARAADGLGSSASWPMVIHPKTNVLALRQGEQIVNGTTAALPFVPGAVHTFTSGEPAVWSSSKPGVVTAADGIVTVVGTGTAVVTAKCGSCSGSFTVTVSNLAESLTVQPADPAASADLTSGTGKLTLQALITPVNASSKAVTWTSSNPAAAAVSAKGVVTAKKGVYRDTPVTITAAAKDGSGLTASYTVVVHPAATGVVISNSIPFTTVGALTGAEETVSGRTITVDIEEVNTLKLSAAVFPFHEAVIQGETYEGSALGGVTWTSGSKKLAEITHSSPEGATLLLKGTGSVTITAKAADGSGRKAAVKLKLVRLPKSITVAGAESLQVLSGKSLTLKCTPLPGTPGTALTGKALTYTLRPQDAAYASISAKGVLKAAAGLRTDRTVMVTIASKDRPETAVTVSVLIRH